MNTVRTSSTVGEPEIVSSFELRIKSSGREGEIVQEEYNTFIIGSMMTLLIPITDTDTDTDTVGRIGYTKHSELFIRDHQSPFTQLIHNSRISSTIFTQFKLSIIQQQQITHNQRLRFITSTPYNTTLIIQQNPRLHIIPIIDLPSTGAQTDISVTIHTLYLLINSSPPSLNFQTTQTLVSIHSSL